MDVDPTICERSKPAVGRPSHLPNAAAAHQSSLALETDCSKCATVCSGCSVIKRTWPFMASIAASAFGRPMNCTKPHPLPAGIFTYTISPKRWKIALSWSSVTCQAQHWRTLGQRIIGLVHFMPAVTCRSGSSPSWLARSSDQGPAHSRLMQLK